MIILTFLSVYLPGFRAGGPIRTVANMVDRLGEDLHFKIITADRDYNDSGPYATVMPGEWQQVGRASVRYLSPSEQSIGGMRQIINNTEYDILYLNSLFNPRFTISPLLLWKSGMVRRTPVVIAPRGEFSSGALRIKRARKQVYLEFAKRLGLYEGIHWQASSQYEERDIRQWLRHHNEDSPPFVSIAPDLLSIDCRSESICRSGTKRHGQLRIISVCRITQMKNLIGALRCLKGLRGTIEFDICGPMDDPRYWEECKRVLMELPANVSVRYLGPIPHEHVLQEFMRHDLFLLPTFGENFGHAIVEALSAGCPVVISDRTPWRALEEKGVGWDLPLEEVELFRDVLQHCVNMEEDEHRVLRERARRFGEALVSDCNHLQQNKDLFLKACRKIATISRTAKTVQAPGEKNECRVHFDKLASEWAEKFKPGGSLHGRAAPFIYVLRKSIKQSGRVLDFGCGSGDITIACYEAGFNICGVDVSPAMIERAIRRANGHGSIFTLVQNTESLALPYEGETFDAIIASSVLEYVRDPVHCLKELCRISIPGACLILTVPNVLHSRRWFEAVIRHALSPKYFKDGSRWQLYAEYLALSQNHLGLKAWTKLLKESGWQLMTVTEQNSPLVMIVAEKVTLPSERSYRSGASRLVLQSAE